MSFALVTQTANYPLNYLFKEQAENAAFNAGSTLHLYDASDVEMGSINTTFASASEGRVAGTSAAASTSAGTIAKARFKANGATLNASAFLTVGTAGSGADIILSTLTGGGSVTIQNYDVAVLSHGGGGTKLNTSLRNSMANLFGGKTPLARFVTSTPGSTARMRFYSGTPPTSADSAATGTMLWDREMLSADFGSVASGQIAISSALTVNASATGTIGYGRLERSGGHVLQFLVNTDTSADAQVDSLSAVSGNALTVQTFAIALL